MCVYIYAYVYLLFEKAKPLKQGIEGFTIKEI